MLVRRASLEDLAMDVGLPVSILQYLADLGYIHPIPQLPAVEFDELRRIRRLIDDLGVPFDAIDLVLHMRRRMLAMQREINRLRAELAYRRAFDRVTSWVDAEWYE
ncbi:chaperone modulator CbpM [Chloroflexus sp.]|uniref:chaperone modulator CbpM n=1 Tax=Chloroflexus sp. TaxID=1904827 RepID=UPI002603A87A|nr:chaperone modulator CbpM [uncultured Chloroflexus sp.]